MNISPKLLKACKKGDRLAQSELYRLCFGVLMGVSVRYVKQDEEARALVNAGFLKVLTKLDSYRSKVPFEAWIRRIMINTVIDQYRREKKYRENMQLEDLQAGVWEAKAFDLNEAAQRFDAEELMELVRQLPATSQRVFNLFAIDGYSHKEISKMLEISVGTSKWHVSFARKNLTEMIQKKMKVENKLLL